MLTHCIYNALICIAFIRCALHFEVSSDVEPYNGPRKFVSSNFCVTRLMPKSVSSSDLRLVEMLYTWTVNLTPELSKLHLFHR